MADPYQEKYKRHRARVIRRLQAEHGIAGGQGRKPEHLVSDATGVAFLAVLAVCVLALIAARGCCHG